jgi:hypothetical protein
MTTKHLTMSDTFLQDAKSGTGSLRGRIDCAFESGYLALLGVLTDDERPRDEHPSINAIEQACARLDLEAEQGVVLARARYYPAERDNLEEVLAWAESVRARAKQYLEINDEP